jgi:hypothetical protein
MIKAWPEATNPKKKKRSSLKRSSQFAAEASLKTDGNGGEIDGDKLLKTRAEDGRRTRDVQLDGEIGCRLILNNNRVHSILF